MNSVKLIFLCLLMLPVCAYAEITVVDDSGNKLVFEKPVQRIISLAPHATELLFAAGADKQILATVDYSDYPEQAKKIPRIGNYKKVDYEKILSLQPQLVIYWKNGNPENMIDGIKNLKVKLFDNEPKNFEDVAASIRMLGKLLGTEQVAEMKAREYLDRLEKLREKYLGSRKNKVSVLYQVWNQPLMTINRQHLINDVIEFCGGINVFADIDNIVPTVDIESIMLKKPDVIIAGMAKGREGWLNQWQRWKALDAVKNNNVYGIDAALIVRQTPRILDGTEEMCEILQRFRNKHN